ncbi:protein phosphatase 1 regulatory subunit 21 [Exaiptasia diaphana]|uniref:Protein phosphatase 1 regulatory subunit 21 n=1 Tax=Exaiptasia diaphana TaxID=2652724 RepID=A0A913XJU1_EXADI|nr:protein phosphatase 1 regulatory subunit 21 [Exaiptasia diaphana]KXJ25659.1 Protein phosphatase 1 regulatory subunit 21 [Exaiptasia diaphana]
MSAEGQNLQAKYQKLASEYAKLRAQNTVLKKAVIEEQEKTKTLQEGGKQKDQTIRKYEQEIDSLQFRNDQLSKRVTVLQDELDNSGSKTWKSWGSPNVSRPTPDNDVIDEELQIKIQENERLQRQLFETSQEQKAIVSSLQERLEVAERTASTHQKAVDEAAETHRMVIDKLQEDRAMMEARLRKTEDELRTAVMNAEKSQQRLEIIKREMSDKYESAAKIIADKLPFNDTCDKEINILNVPTHDRKHQVKSKELIGLAAELIKEFTSALSNLHTYTEQRIKTFYVESAQQQLSAQTQKFCGYLHENAAVLRSVEHSFTAFYKELKTDSLITLETVSGLNAFAESFHNYIKYLEKLLPYYRLSTEEECSSSPCSTTLENHNKQVVASFAGMVRILSKVDSYVQALTSASSGNGLLPTNYNVCFMQLTCFLEELHESVKELSKHFHSKITVEHQLPTTTQTLKTTDDCIVSSLVFLVTVTGKIVKFMNNNLDFLTSKSVLRTRGASTATEADLTTSPLVVTFRHQAASYMTRLTKPRHESVPYNLSIHNHHVLATSKESSDTLSQQITHNQERLAQLEQTKEHWMLECQLLQVKYEKECNKVKSLQIDLEKAKSRLSGDEIKDASKDRAPSSPSHSRIEPDYKPTDLGDVLLETTTEVSDGMTRETLIKNHFTSRIGDLTTQLQITDSKAASFATECRSLYKRITQTDKERRELAAKLLTANSKVKQVEDELDVTKRNYETQLSMMSEHLCGMNEKLTTQQDEIESLKTSGRTKKAKK